MDQQSQTADNPSVERRRHDPSRQLESGLAALENRLRQPSEWFKYGFAVAAVAAAALLVGLVV